MVAARPLSVLSTVTRPVVWFLSRSADVAVRLMGGDPSLQREDVTEEELRDMVAAQTSFTPQQRVIISGAFEIADRTLREVLRPRPDVLVLDEDTPSEEALEQLIAAGHSRAPVGQGGDLDYVNGVVHLRDLVRGTGPVGRLAKPPLFFPESAKALDVLRDMQMGHQQLAIVIGEHGGGEGIVTLEDLVEELVGEIYDESDRDILAVEHQADGSIVLPGRFPVHDLPDIGVEVPEGDYATVAGVVLHGLGRIPDGPGDTTEVEDWEMTVLAVENRAITRVHLRRRERSEEDEEQTAEEAASEEP
jgi:putative hemolysin